MAFIGYSTATNTTNSATLSISTLLTPPAGGTAVTPPIGTLVLCMMNGGTNTATLSTPTGFTAIPNCAQQVVGNVDTQGGWYCVIDGTEASTLTLTSSASNKQTAFLLGFSGRNTSGPFSDSQATPQKFSVSPVAMATNSVSANANDDVAILGAMRFYDGTNAKTYAQPTGFGNAHIIYGNAQFCPAAFWSIDQNVSAGTYGASAGTITTADTASQGWAAYIVALAANPVAPSFISYAGTGLVAIQGAIEIIDPTVASGTGYVTITGFPAPASIGFPAFGGTLVGSPDYSVSLPYRSFTVVHQ